MDCINLSERFGDRFRIRFDPAYAPDHRPKDKLDPWMILLEFRSGNIYPHGGELLAVEIEERGPTRKRLSQLPSLTLNQDGDDFQAWTFHLRDFEGVAEIVRPRRRRVLSDAHRTILRDRGQCLRFQPRGKTAIRRP